MIQHHSSSSRPEGHTQAAKRAAHCRVKKWHLVLQWLFFLLFGFCFTSIAATIVFNTSVYPYSMPFLLIVGLAAAGAIGCIYRLVKKHEAFFTEWYPTLLWISMFVMFAVQILLGNLLRFGPTFDLEAIYQGALEWVNTGSFGQYSSQTCYKNYFYIFPNNMGSMAFLALIFKLSSLLHFTDYFFAAMLVNSLLLVVTMRITSRICSMLWGVRQGIMALVLFFLSPPFYLCAPVFYTDSLSMLFPVLVFYLFLKSQRLSGKGEQKKRALYYVAAGLAAAVGMLLKFTVVIVVIAIGIYLLCQKSFRRMAAFLACTVLILVGTNVGFKGYIYHNHLDKSVAEKENTPYLHWIMMSLGGNGGYNNNDYLFTRSLREDPQTREEKIKEQIGIRLDSLGPDGLLRLFEVKAARSFGDGTWSLSDFLDDNPVKETVLHKFVLYDSEHYPLYRHICTGIYLAIFVMMLFSAYENIFGRREKGFSNFVPQLCLLGLMLFLLIWEVNGRYTMNFVPMIFISAIGGMEYFFRTMQKALALMRKSCRTAMGAWPGTGRAPAETETAAFEGNAAASSTAEDQPES